MTDEQIAQLFHEQYELLAPSFGYSTREESRKPWAEVPPENKALMVAVCGKVREELMRSTIATPAQNAGAKNTPDQAADRANACSKVVPAPAQKPVDFRMLGYELDGVIYDTERDGFDEVCLDTVKRVRVALAALASAAAPSAPAQEADDLEKICKEGLAQHKENFHQLFSEVTGTNPTRSAGAQEPVVAPAVPEGWQRITKPGQVKVGTKLRFTIGDKKYSETAKLILHPGTDREEIIYNKRQNYYLITSMAIKSKGSQKNVEFLTAAPPSVSADKPAAAKQAEIDRLMLEYCPDEMTPEQLAEWGKHQRPAAKGAGGQRP